jgi:hypothetical protein
MKFNKYHKIPQFRDVVRTVQHMAHFIGLDEDNQPIYDSFIRKPILTFTGTVKLHGTNAMITYTPEEGIRAGKRSSLLPPKEYSAHFEFNGFVWRNEGYFTKKMHELWEKYCSPGEQITIFGEWAGEGIQKGVGISELPKAFYIFDCKVRNIETNSDVWIDVDTPDFNFDLDGVYNIHNFITYKVIVDFEKPKESQNAFIELTESVEKECPVALELGAKDNLIGEGIVWTTFWKGEKLIFKVKGEKHSNTKVKKLAKVDTEKLESIDKFVEYACTENRIEQGIQESNATETKDVGNLIRWVANDILAEESDTLKDNNLEWKEVAKDVATKTRKYYFDKLNEIL